MKYKLYNNGVSVVVNSLGAEVKSMIHDDIEYIWPGSQDSWNRSSPILFPIVGSLKNKKTTIFDQEYVMSQHGFLRDQEFTLVSQESNEIILEFKSTPETMMMYPFNFTVRVIHTLEKRSLTTTIQIVNDDEREMFFNIGGHPGFSCPIFDNEVFSDYRIEFEKSESFASPSVESDATLNFDKPYRTFKNLNVLHLDYDYFEIDAIIIPKVNSSYVKLLNKDNKGIKFSFGDFNSFAIWTHPNKSPFVCLEPWIGYADSYNSEGIFTHKPNLIYLKANKEFTCAYKIEIIK